MITLAESRALQTLPVSCTEESIKDVIFVHLQNLPDWGDAQLDKCVFFFQYTLLFLFSGYSMHELDTVFEKIYSDAIRNLRVRSPVQKDDIRLQS